MTIWHCHVAVSLDGRLARKDGSVEDWLVADYTPDSTAFAGFLAGVDAILMGRDTFDAIMRMGEWPYPGKPAVVMTHRPLGDDAPEGVEARWSRSWRRGAAGVSGSRAGAGSCATCSRSAGSTCWRWR